MAIFAVGINHTTASVDLRERVAFNPEQLEQALPAIQQLDGVNEAVIVSTCNRTEIYYQGHASSDLILGWLAGYHRMGPEVLQQHIYSLSDAQAIEHLMKVASGLDSLVLGEPQILGQVKQAYQTAKRQATVGGVLERLFQRTFSVAKTVRNDTGVGQNAVSVAYAAVNLAKHIFADIHTATVLLVGAGDTAELCAQHLREHGVKQLLVANRTLERAEKLAHQFDGEAHALGELPNLLPRVDIVVSSTASTLPIIGKGMVESVLRKRRHRPMLFIDLAVPRDIEEQVNELDDAYLYSVDDLQGIISENMKHREQAAREGAQIIQQHAIEFQQWLQSLSKVDLVREYRHHQQQLMQEQLDKARTQLAAGKVPDEVLDEFAHKLIQQMMHQPTQAMKRAATSGDIAALLAYQQLYKPFD